MDEKMNVTMENQETTVALQERNTEVAETEFKGFIYDLTTPSVQSYCSMHPETEEELKALYNCMNNPKYRVGDFINKTITLKNVYVETVNLVNETTGEVQTAPRTVLIDDKNQGYACVSMVVFSALKKLFMVAGTPDTWKKPIKVEIQQITKGSGNTVRNLLTFNLV